MNRQGSIDNLFSDELIQAVVDLHTEARALRQRRALVLSGPRQWCIEAADALLGMLEMRQVHWFSDAPPPGAASSHGSSALRLLGTEMEALVFDAYGGFDPDAFGALTGAIRGGGLLLLLTPPSREWQEFPDPENRRITVAGYPAGQLTARFLQRLVRVLGGDPYVLQCDAGELTKRPARMTTSNNLAEPFEAPYRSEDQKRAVEAVVKVVTGHRRRPVVLTSDRGRGKSSAFGIAAAQLIEQGRQRILLTGPGAQSVDAVLRQARALLPEDKHGALHFVAADELVREPQPADLLLVDEAAAIPTPLLEVLLKRYARIAFATTVHGYEGTGRGFALRFNRILDGNTNSWKSITLSTPIRWAANDALERLVFRMLLLDAVAAPDDRLLHANTDSYSMERLDRDRLLEDETALGELFGLLVLAHYRTRPLDLRHLLDGPNLSVYVMRSGGHIAATALVAEEGGFDADAAQAIWAGRSRPQGHLLPETLAAYQGLSEAPCLRCARIVRIAVHPVMQRRGLGSRLLEYISGQLGDAGYDYIGSSFGATADLLDFWKGLGWSPVRLGIQRGASSGSHSVVMLRPLNKRGAALFAAARERFYAHFPHQLADSLRDIEPELVQRLMQSGGDYAVYPDSCDWQDIHAFAHEKRLLEGAIGAVWRLACYALMCSDADTQLQEKEIALLVARVLQKRPWPECAAMVGAAGQSQALALLRGAVARLIRYHSRVS